MRSEEDIVEVRIEMSSLLSLDWERIENDPIWIQIGNDCNLSDPAQRHQALLRYIGAYIGLEKFFRDCPSTNGPASVWAHNMEIQDNALSCGTSTGNGDSTAGLRTEDR